MNVIKSKWKKIMEYYYNWNLNKGIKPNKLKQGYFLCNNP